jgi:hypothetical protein
MDDFKAQYYKKFAKYLSIIRRGIICNQLIIKDLQAKMFKFIQFCKKKPKLQKKAARMIVNSA